MFKPDSLDNPNEFLGMKYKIEESKVEPEMEYLEFSCLSCDEFIVATDSFYLRDYPSASTGWLNGEKAEHDEHSCSVLNKW